LPSCFCPFVFQTLSPDIFFFSSRRRKKTIEKKKNAEKGRSLPFKLSLCPLTFGSRFCPHVFAFSIQLLSPWHLLLKQKKKKTIEKIKNVEKGGSLPFFSRFYIWDEALLLLSPFHIPSMLSSPPSSSLVSRLCVTQARELSRALEME
jgi:hypothetical protein